MDENGETNASKLCTLHFMKYIVSLLRTSSHGPPSWRTMKLLFVILAHNHQSAIFSTNYVLSRVLLALAGVGLSLVRDTMQMSLHRKVHQ
jgi:hypothetical protein